MSIVDTSTCSEGVSGLAGYTSVHGRPGAVVSISVSKIFRALWLWHKASDYGLSTPLVRSHHAGDDRRMEQWAKLIEAIGSLIGAVAWPVAVVLVTWLIMRRHRAAFERLIDRMRSVNFPGGQIDLDGAEAAARAEVEALVERAADPDSDEKSRREAARELAVKAENLGALSIFKRGPWIEVEADPRTEKQWSKLAEWIEAAREQRRKQRKSPPDEPPPEG